jgi:putative phosphoribosyl transferase
MNTATHIIGEDKQVTISADGVQLRGTLSVPRDAKGIVLFAHGSGSSRFSSRNQYVARTLQQANIATLLFDLLDEQEASDRQKVFNIHLLAERLKIAAAWVQHQDQISALHLGYFGASTGAAAALVAAADQGDLVKAIVSRGGRPDLAGGALSKVQSPTLLIVGGDDEPVVELNCRALTQLGCEKQLKIVPGATHLFAESGALEQVAYLASQWFQLHLTFTGSIDPRYEH